MYEDAFLDSYWEGLNEPYFGAYGDDDRYEDDSDREHYYDEDDDEFFGWTDDDRATFKAFYGE